MAILAALLAVLIQMAHARTVPPAQPANEAQKPANFNKPYKHLLGVPMREQSISQRRKRTIILPRALSLILRRRASPGRRISAGPSW